MTALCKIQSAITTLVCLLLFSGCANQPPEKTGVITEEGCQMIHRIIDDYPAGFAAFKQGASPGNSWQSADVWDATAFYPDTKCQIWGWANGRSNYSCQWKESDQETAQGAYEQYKPEIARCLGNQWSASEPAAKTGKETIFGNPSTRAVVSIRYYQDTNRPFAKPWYTAMIIGDRIVTVKK